MISQNPDPRIHRSWWIVWRCYSQLAHWTCYQNLSGPSPGGTCTSHHGNCKGFGSENWQGNGEGNLPQKPIFGTPHNKICTWGLVKLRVWLTVAPAHFDSSPSPWDMRRPPGRLPNLPFLGGWELVKRRILEQRMRMIDGRQTSHTQHPLTINFRIG